MANLLTTLLLAQRANGTTIADLPADLVPADIAAAYAIQDEIAAELGPVGAWKVGPMPETGVPMCAPIPAADVHESGVTLRHAALSGLGIEVEVAVTIATDLPGKAGGYSSGDLRQAVGSLHLILELLASRYVDRSAVPLLATVADLQSNGAVIVGPAQAADRDWPEFGAQHMSLALDGAVAATTTGNATTENVLAALAWLANHAVERGMPLKSGQLVITGARLGPADFAGSVAVADAPGLGSVTASFV